MAGCYALAHLLIGLTKLVLSFIKRKNIFSRVNLKDKKQSAKAQMSTQAICRRIAWYLLKLYLFVYSVVCNGLVIKQLTTNSIHFFVSVFLQLDNLDTTYQANILSEIIGVISLLGFSAGI